MLGKNLVTVPLIVITIEATNGKEKSELSPDKTKTKLILLLFYHPEITVFDPITACKKNLHGLLFLSLFLFLFLLSTTLILVVVFVSETL